MLHRVADMVLLQRLEQDPAASTLRDAGLDHDLGPGTQPTHHTAQHSELSPSAYER
jgi:hypothetical protein